MGIFISKEASLIEDSRPLPRKARPIGFQKLVENFDKNEDPFKHMANCKQVLEVELIHHWHTQFGGFGTTLDGGALTWFQNLGRG